MKKYFIFTIIILTSILLIDCDKTSDRVARWNVSIRKEPDKNSKISTWLSKGEKVKVIKTVGEFEHIRLAGGKEGYVEKANLAIESLLISSDDIEMLRRPSVSSGKSNSAKNIKKGAVVFVIETLKNEEGQWLKITGGSSKHPVYKYIEGWIKEGYGYENSNSIVRSGIELETAILKKDLDTLKKLANESEPISLMAAAQIVEIEGIHEAPLEEETEVAPEKIKNPEDQTKEPVKKTDPVENP